MSDANLSLVSREQTVSAGGGDDGGSNHRLRAVEESVRELRRDLKGLDDKLRAAEGDIREVTTKMDHLATKDDLSKMETRQTRWLVGTLITAVIALAAVMTFLSPGG